MGIVMKASRANIALIETVAIHLGPLRSRVVFLGGATIALLITDDAAPYIRATDDVDVIVEVASYGEYMNSLRSDLLGCGFLEDHSDGAPICRWIVAGIKVDVMPTDESIFGFGNKWSLEALRHAVPLELSDDLEIRLVTAPYMLATKLEAFYGRGEGDYWGSRDIEDIIRLIDGRPSIVEEIRNADDSVRMYLVAQLGTLLRIRDFVDAIQCHLLGDDVNQSRATIIEERLRRIARK